ncbi:hypothetical protein P175DRAFT_0473069 [Aspergillus ochraceoroseus IBT 24754]|uniref:RNA ligase/cyclic nucleotide phosphodiesterase n=2 Tax=Aspergillus ochraceoroseus TaxID=138278 RepID=A0A2T5M188_9EURO|nr:uncharacterized protein P175DRAFT_0473069 [Aspergillus ochraceoroseus IBT 24754]KKK21136.1 hypothetical protein AOCH_002926 [Aspergillus ochraceoroseus]PTU22296.1 hypothetical protein P175DRAFT_0473069 [Aspergillus ochraceoroseus IBT 24754]
MSSVAASEDNPFQPLISQTNSDPAQLQSRYENHRATRNAQQAANILAADFDGWSLDEILIRLEGPGKEEGFVDPRNCLVIWARPPSHVRELIGFVQSELKSVAPTLWLMPLDNLHMTVLEAAHSLTQEQIQTLVDTLNSSTEISTGEIADYTYNHRARLIKPMVSFDSAAMALSFVPAAAEDSRAKRSLKEDSYSYHHLRRDIFEMVRSAGIPVASRYSVPSAHVTIARFITQDGFTDHSTEEKPQVSVSHSRVKLLIDKIEEINKRLEAEYWPQDNGGTMNAGEWLVGQEKGLVIRKGRLWYGGGEDVELGKGD